MYVTPANISCHMVCVIYCVVCEFVLDKTTETTIHVHVCVCSNYGCIYMYMYMYNVHDIALWYVYRITIKRVLLCLL